MSTLGAIRDNVRRNLGETTPRFYTNAELNQYIGEAYKKYSLKMLEDGSGYFQLQTQIGFTANQAYVDLSVLNPVFYNIARLERQTTTGTYPLKPSERRFTPNSTFYSGVADSYRPTYKIKGLLLYLEPTPLSTEPSGSKTQGLLLDYNYVPTFPVYNSVDTFTFDPDFSVFFEPMIELYATIAAMEAKDAMGGVSDIQSFRNRLTLWEQDFDNSLERTEYPDSVQYIGNDYRTNNWYY